MGNLTFYGIAPDCTWSGYQVFIGLTDPFCIIKIP